MASHWVFLNVERLPRGGKQNRMPWVSRASVARRPRPPPHCPVSGPCWTLVSGSRSTLLVPLPRGQHSLLRTGRSVWPLFLWAGRGADVC